jgi:hypothetical protein
LKSDNNLKQG